MTATSRYRCRSHPEFAVTARGTGCLECDREYRWLEHQRQQARRDRDQITYQIDRERSTR